MPDSTPWFDFQLSGLADGWNYESTCRRDAEEVCVVQFRFRREQAGPLPELRLEFELPWLDMQLKWQPRRNASDCHHFFPYWWDGGKIPYGITHNQPLWVFANEAGENRLALACSECRRIVLAGCGVAEKTIQCRLLFHTTPCDPAAEFSFELRIDRRALPYDTVLRDLAAWQAERYPAAPVPASALLPVYSTWYQYQKGVSQEELEKELPFAAAAGMKTLILDDGWQCAGNGGDDEMSVTGEWRPEPGKFPDLAGFVERCRESGLECLLWVGLPFVGRKCPVVYERFRGKFLLENGSFGILDPRFPEVREHLAEVCRRLMTDYGLAGLKLDFIDQVHLIGRDDPVKGNDPAGRDFRSVEEALDELLGTIHAELRTIRPDALIEFRQFYCGPAARRHCNILRAQDCPGDGFQNRMRTVDLRLTCATTTVHADMIPWHPAEQPAVILRQLLNTLFSVPQISVRLTEMPDESRRAVAAYLKFTEQHRELLLKGRLAAPHPEQYYPVVSSTLGDETLIAAYAENRLLEPPEGVRKIVVVNASSRDSVLLHLNFPALVKIFELSGKLLREESSSPGLREIGIPSTGYAVITAEPFRKGGW